MRNEKKIPNVNLQKKVVIMAKHLCGVATYLALRSLESFKIQNTATSGNFFIKITIVTKYNNHDRYFYILLVFTCLYFFSLAFIYCLCFMYRFLFLVL